jgi:hypothetical protein
MTFWKNTYLAAVKGSVFSDVNKVQYQLSDSWSDCTIDSSGTEGEYKYFICSVPSSVSGTITGIRFLKSDSSVMGETTVSVPKTAVRAFYFRIKFNVKEAV